MWESSYREPSKKEYQVLMIGLNFAGKTSLLYKLKTHNIVTTIPTIANNVETISFDNSDLTIWDLISGNDIQRRLWKHYLPCIDGIIYVIDSTDIDRISESKEILVNFLQENKVENIPILLFCNKQDLPNAATPLQIKAGLRFKTESLIIGCSVITGEGIKEGFDWFTDILIRRVPSIISNSNEETFVRENNLDYNYKLD